MRAWLEVTAGWAVHFGRHNKLQEAVEEWKAACMQPGERVVRYRRMPVPDAVPALGEPPMLSFSPVRVACENAWLLAACAAATCACRMGMRGELWLAMDCANDGASINDADGTASDDGPYAAAAIEADMPAGVRGAAAPAAEPPDLSPLIMMRSTASPPPVDAKMALTERGVKVDGDSGPPVPAGDPQPATLPPVAPAAALLPLCTENPPVLSIATTLPV